jgi:hypothetical protein
MGMIQIPVKKPIAKAEQLSAIAQEIDRYGELAAAAAPVVNQIKELKKKLKPIEDQGKLLEKLIGEMTIGDDDETVEKGAKFVLEIGKAGNSRSIKDLGKARDLLGDELFMQLATVTLKNLDDYLTPPQKAEVIEERRTAHSYKVLPRVA